MANEYLMKEYELCFEQLRFYDERHEKVLTYTFNLTAAAATAQFAIFNLLHGATVGFFEFAAILSGLIFIATVLLFMAQLQNRLYFVYVARQLNAIRGYLMSVDAASFRNNQMYTSFDFPALRPFSVHTFTLIGSALISSLFAGGCAYAIGPAVGHAGCLAVGVETGLVILVAESACGIGYLLRAGSKSADKVIHSQDLSIPKVESTKEAAPGPPDAV
jgi:hypothetical protein